jgi:hypothetical protein
MKPKCEIILTPFQILLELTEGSPLSKWFNPNKHIQIVSGNKLIGYTEKQIVDYPTTFNNKKRKYSGKNNFYKQSRTKIVHSKNAFIGTNDKCLFYNLV